MGKCLIQYVAQSSALLVRVLDLRYFAPFRNHSASDLALLTAVKFTEEMDKMFVIFTSSA